MEDLQDLAEKKNLPLGNGFGGQPMEFPHRTDLT